MSLLAAGATAQGAITMLAMLAVQGTVLALLALAIVRAGRLRPAWHAAIWLVVLAKFVLPYGPAMPWSLADLIAYLRHTDGGGPLIVAPSVAGAAPVVSSWPALGWLALAAVWATGTAIVLARSLAAQRDAARFARTAPLAPDRARTLLAMLAASQRVRAPRLVIGEPTTGPYVVGFFRPIIVVPPALFAEPMLLRAALLHELAHVRRKDALGRVVQVWATAVFFWFPVVRFVARKLDFAREAACDAWALEAGDLSRPAYARLLVDMAALRVAAAPSLAAPRALNARVAAVLGPPARARLTFVHRVALLGWAVLALGGARSAAARGQPDVCVYTPQIAEALRQAYPEADLDGDGVLSRDEACEFQADARRRVDEEAMVSLRDDQAVLDYERLLAEPLCCNCDPGDGVIPSSGIVPADASCQRSEGVAP